MYVNFENFEKMIYYLRFRLEVTLKISQIFFCTKTCQEVAKRKKGLRHLLVQSVSTLLFSCGCVKMSRPRKRLRGGGWLQGTDNGVMDTFAGLPLSLFTSFTCFE